ncbi:putative protein phosphatase 2C 61, partial [Tetrabaena socialis]
SPRGGSGSSSTVPRRGAWGVVPASPTSVDAAGVSLPGYAPGYKDQNQDSALLLDAFLSSRQQLLAVMDGHGPEGHRVSAFVRQNLPFTLLNQLVAGGGGGGNGGDETDRSGDNGRPVQRAMQRTVASLDAQLAGSGIDVASSGTTAVLCHVHGRQLTAAWVGDSRAVLGLPEAGAGASGTGGRGGGGSVRWGGEQRGAAVGASSEGSAALARAGGSPAPPDQRAAASRGGGGDGRGGGMGWRVAWSSTDHKPEAPGELERIEAAGGRVARSMGPRGPVGPFRVWFKNEDQFGLAMSRALGDLPGRQLGVTATPSTASLQLPAGDGPAVLVLASDGVWELLDN